MKIGKLKTATFILLSAFLLNFVAIAQQTSIYTHEDATFKLGMELFEKQKFGAAQKSFIKAIQSHKDPQSLVRIDAEYYSALCAIELFNKDGEVLLKKFI